MNKKVAIVAVHGVGQHLAGETQDAMADLLLSLPGRGPFGSARQYKPFVAVNLQIPLQPVETGGGPSTAVKPKFWRRFTHLYEEQSAKFAGYAKGSGPTPPGQAGLEYTEQLLRDYKGGQDGNVYRTARLEGQKISDGTEVHIYEVLWADLAKPNNTVIRFFLSLFQLILHLASLSRLAVDTGAGEGRGRLWETYRALQRYAVRIFQIFIPLLEILILIALASCLIEVWSTTKGHIWVPIALGAVGAIAAGIVIITKAKREALEQPWVWALRALLPVALGAAIPLIVLWILGLQSEGAGTRADIAGALLFWLIPGFGFLFWILSMYEDERAGAFATGMTFFAAGIATFVWFLWQAHRSPCPDTPVVVLATLWTAQFLLSLARWFWGAMVLCAIAASLLGGIGWRLMKRRKPAGPEWGRARAAVRTSRLALALPTLLFLLVTLLIWAAFLTATRQLMPEGDPIFSPAVVDESTAAPWYARWEKYRLLPPEELTVRSEKYLEPLKEKEDHRVNNYALRVLAWTMGYHLPVMLALVTLTSFLLAWLALPSVFTESMIHRGERKPPRDTDDAVSLRMGTWLSRGLDATTVVTLFVWSAIFLVPILYKLANYKWPQVGETLGPITFAMVSNTLIGFALLAAIAKGAQTVLATVLDVDTYLRTSPIYATPRATIFERYISTLRYLRAYRDAQNRGYDSIIIVAHSLGALISGDLLYYLQSDRGRKEWCAPSPAGPKFTLIPLTLLTMGNPTRQLLNRFFPYLYDWVRPVPDNGMHALPGPLNCGQAVIHNSAMPDPHKLGLACWINAYRSGDYVGRSLWLDEWYYRPAHSAANPIPTVIASPDDKRQEMCIGAGAHVHYMDDTAPDIAWKLDSLL